MRTLAMLSLHSSPLVQPGTGDSGGMNVYVRELSASLAQAGVDTVVYVRRWDADLPDTVELEPGVRVVHVDAGDPDLPKEALPEIVDEFADGVLGHLLRTDVDVLHANYWLSALAGHRLKHELELPLVSTFHTLARVKAETGDPEPERRDIAEAEVLGCCDVVVASCTAEAEQLQRLYGTPSDRIEIVPPGVDHAFFSPGDRRGARTAIGLETSKPLVLFVGRIQPLKGLDVALDALAQVGRTDAELLIVGGPSGVDGPAELDRAHERIASLGLAHRVHFVPPQPHHLLSTYYRAADVVVVPSRSESFGLVALEAAACGVPVVASAVGGLTTIVEHGRTGFLVESRDPAIFARSLDRILGDAALARQFGDDAARVAGRYRWSTTAGRLRRVYADLAARAPIMC